MFIPITVSIVWILFGFFGTANDKSEDKSAWGLLIITSALNLMVYALTQRFIH